MIKENTLENKKLLAEFLGYTILSKRVISVIDNDQLKVFNPNKDWNWIMQVVEKIETIENNRYTVEINQGHCNIYDMVEEEEIISIFNESKIDSVNIACSDFVKMKSNSNHSELLEEGAQNHFSKYFSVSGFWKDDKVKFSDYIIKELDIVDENEDLEIFYYGLSEREIKEVITLKWDTEYEFVITSYQEILQAEND